MRYFTRSLVKELTESPVIISTPVPGLIATEMLAMQYTVATPRRRRLYDSLADRPETIAAGVAPRLLANRKHGAVVSWLGPREIAKRLIIPAWRKRGLLSGAAHEP